ncbi:hypothetical protein ACEQ8H_005610 [Pleosporales sp. CAS-2024a]
MKFLESEKLRRSSEDSDEQRLVYNERIARLRKSEYPMLKGITYLDHGGTTLASKTLLTSFARELQNTLLANPHSDAANPSVSSIIVAETRSMVLEFCKADPNLFDIVFVANATAAVKLVMDCFAGIKGGFDYCYHLNSHTSLVGVRELAEKIHCLATNEQTEDWLSGQYQPFEACEGERPTLFAYPAQSNMNGQRLPLHWSRQLRQSNNHPRTFTLLDAAAFVSTTPFDLSDHETAPDFVALSFYKIFGFPDLGALIVRKASAHILESRKYFGGGTTEMITCLEKQPWVARKDTSLHARLEDGTVAIRSVLALRCAITSHRLLFISMHDISQHTSWLSKMLHQRLCRLMHENGIAVCHFYKAQSSTFGDAEAQGATITFNIRESNGSWTSPYAVGALLRQRKIHVRTGSLCNPAGMAIALELSSADIRRAYAEGVRCNQQDDVRTGGALFGMVRVTFGAMSTIEDVEAFASCIEHHFVDRNCSEGVPARSDDRRWRRDSKNVPLLREKHEKRPHVPPGPTCRRLRLFGIRRAFARCVG